MKRIIAWFKSRKNVFAGIGATILVLFILELMFDFIIMPIYTHHGAERELPDVTELSFQEAKEVLRKNGLKIVEDRKMFESTYPESTIIQQHPMPYSMVKKGRRIFVTISAGEKPVEVPDVIGISERDALFILREAGLEPEMPPYFEYDSYRPKGVVCDQSIKPGQNVFEHTSISITISNGPLPTEFIVPDLVGKSHQTAKKMLRQAGLIIGIVEFKVNKNLIPNTVISQTILPGEKVEKGTAVGIVLSQLEEDSWQQ